MRNSMQEQNEPGLSTGLVFKVARASRPWNHAQDARATSIPAIPVLVTILKALPEVALIQVTIALTRIVVCRRVAVFAEVRIASVTTAAGIIAALLLAGVVTGIQGCLAQLRISTPLAVAVPVTSPTIVIIPITIITAVS